MGISDFVGSVTAWQGAETEPVGNREKLVGIDSARDKDDLESKPVSSLKDTLVSKPRLTKCKVCAIIRELDEDTADTLNEYIQWAIISITDISKSLREHGYDVSETTIRRHRDGCLLD